MQALAVSGQRQATFKPGQGGSHCRYLCKESTTAGALPREGIFLFRVRKKKIVSSVIRPGHEK